MPIEDAFEMLFKILYHPGTQFVEDASDFHSLISMGIVSIFGSNERPVILFTAYA